MTDTSERDDEGVKIAVGDKLLMNNELCEVEGVFTVYGVLSVTWRGDKHAGMAVGSGVILEARQAYLASQKPEAGDE